LTYKGKFDTLQSKKSESLIIQLKIKEEAMKKFIIYLLGCCFLSTALFGCSHLEPITKEATIAETEEQPTATAREPAVPVTENPDHDALLASDDPQLSANKRLVYDMWRTLVEARDVEAAKQYIDKNYIEHNPIADTGLAGVLAYFSSLGEPLEISDRIQLPLVTIVAERDLVALVFVDEQENPNVEGETYTTTRFDMYRVKDGMIIEHWAHGTLPSGMTQHKYVPTEENPDHESSLANDDPQLAANKRLVYDMWRTLLDAKQVEEAPRFLAKDYIQHNPMANTGLEGFMTSFRRFAQSKPVQEKVAHFIDIITEGDWVILATLREYKDANGDPYTTAWFDMWVVEDGLLAEHWDTVRLSDATPPPPE
jgi:predicted SnoaL-like aldol condensation-catalyzing enzyme